ncbi:hypothetical protein RI129_000183 [Pyrocoelia pectoralis]|uniref:Endonuclease-reverse transcriptase n=1 Tax=Pyrocoelia pectoralis TaxID=417401 RepID=A0AAN7UYD8_9COLE
MQTKDKGILFNCTTCTKRREEINDLKQLLLDLRKDIEALKLHKSSAPAPFNSADKEELMVEIFERQRRQNNIIIYNLEETNPQLSGEANAVTDLVKAKTIVSQVANIDTNGIKIFRLGRIIKENKPRPLKVILNSSYDAISVLRNKQKLRNINNRISVSSDLTPAQQSYLQDLRAQLLDRSTKGEKDLTIRYIKGIPKIVSQKN